MPDFKPTIVNLSSPEAVRTWLRDTLRDDGLTVAEWAQLSGVSKATIWRALSEDYKFMPSSKTLQKLSIPILERKQRGHQFGLYSRDLEPLYVNRELAPKVWREHELDWDNNPPTALESSGLNAIPFVEAADQWLGRVVGAHAEPDYRHGDLVHVVESHPDDKRPYHVGDHVVLARIRAEENLSEVTVRQVKSVDADGKYTLGFINRDGRFGDDIAVQPPEQERGVIVAKILGLVISLHRYRDISRRFREVDHLPVR